MILVYDTPHCEPNAKSPSLATYLPSSTLPIAGEREKENVSVVFWTDERVCRLWTDVSVVFFTDERPLDLQIPHFVYYFWN